MSALEVNLSLHPQQSLAFQSRATEILYGGAAGGGKSHLMRVCALSYSLEIPGLQTYIFRRKFPDLVKNHMEGPTGFRSLLAPFEDAGMCSIKEKEIAFSNGSKIHLCHCKDESSKYNYQGAEIHLLLIDELTLFTETMYRFIRSRVRATNIELPKKYEGLFPRVICGSNPGNIGHTWVKNAFIDKAPPMEIYRTPDEEGGMLRQFIPAKLDDNPTMAEADPYYSARLAGMGNPQIVRAMLNGDWDTVVGAYFPEFDRDKHVIPAFRIPEHWPRFRALDWGSSKPYSVGWWAQSLGDDGITRYGRIPKGALVRYNEDYGALSPNVGKKLPVMEVARRVLAKDDSTKFRACPADPSIFSTHADSPISNKFASMGIHWIRANNDRQSGWEAIRDRLVGVEVEEGESMPMLYVFDKCVDFIRTFPALIHDELRPEDVDTDCEDHIGDETRYMCSHLPMKKFRLSDMPNKGLDDMSGKVLLPTMDDLRKMEKTRRRPKYEY